MNAPKLRMSVLGKVILATIAVVNICAARMMAQATDNSLAGLATAAEAAKAEFRPLSQADLERLKVEVIGAVKRLDERLTAAGPSGETWRPYLKWSALQGELGKSVPDRKVLSEVYQRLSAGQEGMNLVWFVDVQRALRQYLKVAQDIENPKLNEVYEQTLDRLAAALRAYSTKPTPEDAMTISDSLRWLRADMQSPKLANSIEQFFGQPNMYVDISEAVFNAAFGENVNHIEPVHDCILGTTINGTANTVGDATAKLAESDRFGVIDNFLFATAYSNTVGRNGPVCIYSTGTTGIGAIKRLWIDENGLNAYPASSNAMTRNQINDIQSIKGRRIVERIAWKKAYQQLPQAEYVASRHAECRVNARIDERAVSSLAEANMNYQKKIRRPLDEHKLFPADVKFSSKDQLMHIRLMQAGTSLLSTASAPPEAEQGDITMRIHESMINNYALDAVGGMTIRQERAEKGIIDLFGELPEEMKTDPNEAPWGIIFARRQPVSVTFADGGFKVVIRGEGFYKGDELHPAMNVTAQYKIEKTGEGFKAVRQGELQIFPPGFDVEGEKQLSARITATRNLLEKRFSKMLKPEIVLKSLVMKGRMEKAGKFEPVHFSADNGWLTLGWNRLPAEQKATY